MYFSKTGASGFGIAAVVDARRFGWSALDGSFKTVEM
jgi:hypothetical protein